VLFAVLADEIAQTGAMHYIFHLLHLAGTITFQPFGRVCSIESRSIDDEVIFDELEGLIATTEKVVQKCAYKEEGAMEATCVTQELH